MAEPQHTQTPSQAGWIGLVPAVLSLALFAAFASQLPAIAAGDVQRLVWEWVPALGISLSFLLDGLSLTFALLISGIGGMVFLYANTYLAGHPQLTRFMLFLTGFMLAMLGLVLADNLIALFVFWELTTITSYLLIGFGHATENGRRSALQALFVTGAGALALLAGFILLGITAGTFEISALMAQGDTLRAHALYLPILILIIAGTFTKSAQFPFHFWLPNAMAAPTPVSAFLHSATMVKAGVYLMARLYPTLSGTDVWFWTLTIAGAFTALFASVLALRQTDLKQALAYTTLMALGTLTLFLGQSSSYAITGFVTFLVVHSLYKAALFLVVGCIDHATGSRDAETLGGLGRAMPVTAAAAALAALSMAGLPPFLGFIGKELLYAGILAVDAKVLIFSAALIASNVLMFAVAGIVALRPFWGRAHGVPPRAPTEAPLFMLIGPVILGALGLMLGLFPAGLQTTLVDPAVASLLGQETKAKTLTLWHGVNLPLILSGATIAAGVMLYLTHRPARAALVWLDDRTPSFDAGWDRFLKGLKALAAWQTRYLQTGVLRNYIAATLATVLVAIAGTMFARNAWPQMPDISDASWPLIAICLFTCAGAVMTALTSSRIAAMAALGVVGIGVALVFIVFSAPDVAITQLLVETLVVVLVAVALLRLPLLDQNGRDTRPRDAALAIGLGATVTAVILAVLEAPLDRRLTSFFETASWPEAFGRNIVNVILVDFRALDTFGEIAVVVIAALSAYALLRATSPALNTPPRDTPTRQIATPSRAERSNS
ncbi:MAG: putative monovalent cation/H+ antiporter subunit A [Thalassovita mediterranea]|uniref:putative monovalent cation/H+ antiporter subunit A n=1 Tax=Thalassovita mediterranea TaxID=340021 RepID=UPI003C6B205F